MSLPPYPAHFHVCGYTAITMPKGKKRLELGFAVNVVVKYREIRLTNGKREFVPRDQAKEIPQNRRQSLRKRRVI